MSAKEHGKNQQPELVACRFREAFPELCAGKTDQELISEFAEIERKYGHLTIEEKYALLTPENRQKVRKKIAEMLERQAQKEAAI